MARAGKPVSHDLLSELVQCGRVVFGAGVADHRQPALGESRGHQVRAQPRRRLAFSVQPGMLGPRRCGRGGEPCRVSLDVLDQQQDVPPDIVRPRVVIECLPGRLLVAGEKSGRVMFIADDQAQSRSRSAWPDVWPGGAEDSTGFLPDDWKQMTGM
jgi:hypothetical protein